MIKVGLIGCTSKKKNYFCKSEEMYSPSKYFQLRLEYCKKMNFDYIYILSAKYGLLKLDEYIYPYNLNLKNTSLKYRKNWEIKVYKSLLQLHDPNNTIFYLLAGEEYTRFLNKKLKYTKNPVKGLGIGKQLKYYKEKITKLNSLDNKNQSKSKIIQNNKKRGNLNV